MFGGGRDPFDDPFFTGREMAPRRNSRRTEDQDDRRRPRDPFSLMEQMMGGMGGDMFGDMDMDRGMQGGGGGSFTMMSSSTVMSGDGQFRQVTQHSSRSGNGPTVSERREQTRNGQNETLSCARRIGDRSRTITKERDRHGDERTMDTIENMDADAAQLDRFDSDFSRHRSGRNMLAADPFMRSAFGGQSNAPQGGYGNRRALPDSRGDAYDRDRDEVTLSRDPPRRRSKW